MKIAVIKTGGKQYTVAEKAKLQVEKLAGEVGATLDLNEILLVADGKEVSVGKPNVKAAVSATIVTQGREAKVHVVKFKNKTRYHKNVGHRQPFTEIQITKIA